MSADACGVNIYPYTYIIVEKGFIPIGYGRLRWFMLVTKDFAEKFSFQILIPPALFGPKMALAIAPAI